MLVGKQAFLCATRYNKCARAHFALNLNQSRLAIFILMHIENALNATTHMLKMLKVALIKMPTNRFSFIIE